MRAGHRMMAVAGGGRAAGGRAGKSEFFDCWWALFGNRAAENNGEGHSVY